MHALSRMITIGICVTHLRDPFDPFASRKLGHGTPYPFQFSADHINFAKLVRGSDAFRSPLGALVGVLPAHRTVA